MDMNGKHVAITGPTAGIGRAAALALSRLGAQLTLFCRNTAKASDLLAEIEAAGGSRPEVIIMDMAGLDSVRRAADEFLARGQPLDVLLNNAGIVSTSRQQTTDGYEETLAQRLQGQRIAVNCLHPGAVASSLGSQNKGVIAKLVPALLSPFFRSPEKGAQTSIYLCTSDAVEGVTGEYYANCKVVSPKPWGRDDDAAQRLWSYTEKCVDFKYPL